MLVEHLNADARLSEVGHEDVVANLCLVGGMLSVERGLIWVDEHVVFLSFLVHEEPFGRIDCSHLGCVTSTGRLTSFDLLRLGYLGLTIYHQ